VWKDDPTNSSTTAPERSARSAAAATSRDFPIPASAHYHRRSAQRGRLGARPTLLQKRNLLLATHQGTLPEFGRGDPFAQHLVHGDQLVDSLDLGRWVLVELKRCHVPAARPRPRSPPSPAAPAPASRGEVRRQAVDVVLHGVQIHQPAMYPHPGGRAQSRTLAWLLEKGGSARG
jgi:hypothetical protein